MRTLAQNAEQYQTAQDCTTGPPQGEALASLVNVGVSRTAAIALLVDDTNQYGLIAPRAMFADRLGVTDRTTIRSTAALAKIGYLIVERAREANRYIAHRIPLVPLGDQFVTPLTKLITPLVLEDEA